VAANNWRTVESGEDWMRSTEKRLLNEERRPLVSHASDIMGPSLGPYAVPITDWNQAETGFNGIVYSEPGGLNSPNAAEAWIGAVYAQSNGTGLQTAWNYRSAGAPSLWVRSFSLPGGTRAYSPWQQLSGGAGSTTPGDEWFVGAGAPANTVGETGDFYLNSTNGDYYEKVGPSSWALRGSLRGPQGIQGVKGDTGAKGDKGDPGNEGDPGLPGSRWHSGTGPPAAGLGVLNDWYLNGADGSVYTREATGWVLQPGIDLTGPTGPEGPEGERGPSGTLIPVEAVEDPGWPEGTVWWDTDEWAGIPLGMGGDLEGDFPSPTIKNGAVTSAKIADETITHNDVAAANKDGAAAIPSMRTLGTGATQAVAGNDARLSDARAPTAHTHTKANITDFAHTHAAADVASGVLDIARIPVGSTSSTVAVGDHTHTGGGLNTVQEEGVNAASNVTVMNFKGPGVTATDAGDGQVDVEVEGTAHVDPAEPPGTPEGHLWWDEDEDPEATGVSGAGLLEAGQISVWPTTTPPGGWALCDGQAVSRAVYPALFSRIGTTYGAGDGSTTFNLPNLKGRVVVGLDGAQTEFDALGETGGAKTHTLTLAQIPSHNHGGATGGIRSNANQLGDQMVREAFYSNIYGLPTGGGYIGRPILYNNTTEPPHSHTIASEGSGQAHSILQPYITLNYIIRLTTTRGGGGGGGAQVFVQEAEPEELDEGTLWFDEDEPSVLDSGTHIIPAKVSSALPSAYPDGVSIFSVVDATWIGGLVGTVVTHKAGNQRVTQTFVVKGVAGGAGPVTYTRAQETADAWSNWNDTGWVPLTMLNSWTATYPFEVRVRDGVAYLRGTIRGGAYATGLPVAIVPTWARPSSTSYQAINITLSTSPFTAGALIYANGDIKIWGGPNAVTDHWVTGTWRVD
jgi:microcystin-dependent protein